MPRNGRWQSIERQFPLLFSGLLLFVVAALALGAFREMRRLSLDNARARVDGLAGQLATSSVEQGRRRLVAADSVARHPALTAFLQLPSPATRAAAEAVLRDFARDTSQVLAATLDSRAGARVLAVGAPPPVTANIGVARDTGAVTGPLVASGDTLLYAVSAPIGPRGDRLGRVLQWRRLVSNNPRAREQIAQLVGQNAEITFGNADGSLWADMTPKAIAVVPALREGRGVVEIQREGEEARIAAARPVPGTPWLIGVEFSRGAVLAPAHTFLRRIGLIAALLLVASAIGVWVLSRRISRPLRDMTAAAEAVAAGDFSREVRVARDDELGRLAAAFTSMAGHVKGAQNRLEDQVATRTGELSEAMRRLAAAQDELIRKERLAILGQLSSGVGHELRNPLGVMTNAIYYLDTVLKDAPANVKEYLGILRTQIAVSEKIVGDLLDYARVKPPQRAPVALEKVVDEQLGHLKALNVRVVKQFETNGSTAHADSVQVGQIVSNLITNAFQAMEGKGGTLTLRAARENGGKNVRLDVSDSGSGIAAEHLDLVFEPLFTTKARGIGLGLAVSRSLASANGGALTVASQAGAGATFSLVLPADGGDRPS